MPDPYTVTSSTYIAIATVGLAFFVYGAFGRLLQHVSITSAMFFACAGLLVGPIGFDAVSSEGARAMLRLYAEITLALVLCTQTARIDFRAFRRVLLIPARLLGIGLTVSIALGFVLSLWLLPSISWVEAALLAVILAPTDPDLARPITSVDGLPEKVVLGIEIDSGLNDGLCLPILLALAVVASTGDTQGFSSLSVLVLLVEELGLGILVGAAAAFVFIVTARKKHGRYFVGGTWRLLPIAALALSSFGIAQWLGGSGLIASFVAGCCLSFDNQQRRFVFLNETEGLANIVSSLAWIAFGVLFVPLIAAHLSLALLVYAGCSLLLVRGLAVLISLACSSLSIHERLFVAWFGPRGLASIAFVMLLLDREIIAQDSLIIPVVAMTVFISIYVHGGSAKPLARVLSGRSKVT